MSERYALVSVADKTGLVELGRGLVALGWTLVASGGTGRVLEEAAVPYLPVDQLTGTPEAFDGRMKTISFELEGGILFDRDNPAHVALAERLGLMAIDLVACNFAPVLGGGEPPPTTLEGVMARLDVGGPTMVRAAARNFLSVLVLTRPAQYATVLDELRRGEVSMETRRRLAVEAFDLLVEADQQVTRRLHEVWRRGDSPPRQGSRSGAG